MTLVSMCGGKKCLMFIFGRCVCMLKHIIDLCSSIIANCIFTFQKFQSLLILCCLDLHWQFKTMKFSNKGYSIERRFNVPFNSGGVENISLHSPFRGIKQNVVLERAFKACSAANGSLYRQNVVIERPRGYKLMVLYPFPC